MSNLSDYARALVEKAGKSYEGGEVFAKVLSKNDDSGRHGVVIPTGAYLYLPNLPIPDPSKNATRLFPAFDFITSSWTTLAYKYYERYPERRVTRLNGILNGAKDGRRLLVFLRAKDKDGGFAYYFDCATSGSDGRFEELFRLIFGMEVRLVDENFIVRPVDADEFQADASLTELLEKFDDVRGQGWIDTKREGHTGIGYTFETLLGIEENNDRTADFKGIEIKCKGIKEGGLHNSGKINLFQQGPTWLFEMTARERIRLLGHTVQNDLYSCHSQVTTTPNNLGLLLDILRVENKIDLRKNADVIAYWSLRQLEKRLAEKHARVVFVKARSRITNKKTQYAYEELVYCANPSIERFVDLVSKRSVVFEFTMSEKPDGTVRNHGYPWRLVRVEFLDQLFGFQIKLR